MRVLKKSTLVLAVGLLSAAALAFGPMPGKWVLADGAQSNHKPPPISNSYAAFIQNNGPDQVVATSTGTGTTKTEVLQPDGVVVEFGLPAGAKKVVLSDAHAANGLGASGTLFWGELQDPEGDEPGDPNDPGGI